MRSEVVAVVNIGANNTDLGIFEAGVFTFPSPPLSIAGVSFTRELSEALGQSMEQAEITKKEYAVVNLDGFAASSPNDAATGGSGDASGSEPTAFNTAFAPLPEFGLTIGADEPPPVEPEPDGMDAPQPFVSAPEPPSPEPAYGGTFDLGGAPDFGGAPSFGGAPDLGSAPTLGKRRSLPLSRLKPTISVISKIP